MDHLRYPEDLFKVQRYQFARYHVTDSGDFYQGNNRWQVPEDPDVDNHLQPPYRLFVDQPVETGGTRSTFSLTSVFTPYRKSNLAAFVSMDSDATSPTYGQMRVMQLPDTTTPGPGLIANEFASNNDVRDALLKFQSGGAPPLFGNLLTIPVADGLIYVEPVYAVRAGSTSGYPILQYVLVSYGGEVGISTTLHGALADVLGENVTQAPPETNGNGNGNGNGNSEDNTGTLSAQVRAKLQAAENAFNAADAAFREGDTTTWAAETAHGRELVAEAFELASRQQARAGSPN
jgi:uncharacterized membrane protein (UPF0182 family)